MAAGAVEAKPKRRLGDLAIAKRLKELGACRRGTASHIWFDRGALTSAEMDEFAGLVDKGIGDICDYLALPARRRRVIRYYASAAIELSHTSSLGVFLPIWRVKRKSAPYLHETAHALAPCDAGPLWFSEGFASFVQSYVSERYGGYDGAVFSRSGNMGIDREASEWLATSRGAEVVRFVGRSAPPPEIARERENIAAPFYVMSHSLVKFLAANVSPEAFRKLLTVTDFARCLRRITRKSASEWKRDWLAQIAP